MYWAVISNLRTSAAQMVAINTLGPHIIPNDAVYTAVRLYETRICLSQCMFNKLTHLQMGAIKTLEPRSLILLHANFSQWETKSGLSQAGT